MTSRRGTAAGYPRSLRRSASSGGRTYPIEGVSSPFGAIRSEPECRSCPTGARTGPPGSTAEQGGGWTLMRKRWRKPTIGLGLFALAVGVTLVIAGAATADHGYEGNATSHVLVDGNPRCPEGTSDAGTPQDRRQQARRGLRRRIDRHHRARRRSRRVQLEAARHPPVDVQAVIVKGGDAAYIYYYADDNDDSDENLTPPVNNGGQHPQISHVEFCFDPKNASNPDAHGGEDGQRHVDDPAQLVDRQAGQGRGCGRLHLRGQRVALPRGRRQRIVHVEGHGHALADPDLRRHRHDHGREHSGRHGPRRRCHRPDPGRRGDRLRREGQHGLTVPANGSLQCSYSAVPGTQVPNNTATASWGSDNSASDTATIDVGGADRGRRSGIRRGRRPRSTSRSISAISRATPGPKPTTSGGRARRAQPRRTAAARTRRP